MAFFLVWDVVVGGERRESGAGKEFDLLTRGYCLHDVGRLLSRTGRL